MSTKQLPVISATSRHRQPASSKKIKLAATTTESTPSSSSSTTAATSNDLTVACVWRQLRDVYSVTERDIEYAYRGASNFIKIDKLYAGATTHPCRVVLLIDVHHGSLDNFLRMSDALLRVHGLLIVSLTWFHEDRARMLKLDSEATRQRFEEDLAASFLNSDDDDDDDDDNEPSVAKHVDNATTTIFGYDNDDNRGRITDDDYEQQQQQQMSEMINLEDLTTVRAIYIGRRRCVRDRMRNTILMQFFAKLILYLRPLPICDKLGIISHKAFRLVRSTSIDQWYHDLSLATTNVITSGDDSAPSTQWYDTLLVEDE